MCPAAAVTLMMACFLFHAFCDGVQSAAYALPEPTIAYMPHCDLQLYEDVLRANWCPARLPQLVLIANRFSEYVDRCVPV